MENQSFLPPPRVFIVDDDEPLRASLTLLLGDSEFEISGFDSAEQFLEAATKHEVGCVIADARMPGMTGIELLEALQSSESGLVTILITGHADTPLVVNAMRYGAITVLDKPFRESELLDAVRKAWRLSCENREQRVRRRVIRRRMTALSPSERQVLDLVVAGTSNKSIAVQLELSVRTVENRRRSIFQKMHADSVAELVRMIVLVHGDQRAQLV